MSRSLVADSNLLEDYQSGVFNLKGPENDLSSIDQEDPLPIQRIFEAVTPKMTDKPSLIQFPDENETCQTPTLEPTIVANLVRGCDQCLHVTEIPHPPIHIQSPKPDSPKSQL
ncbi:unnamed protein product [Hymenolepis diminuta]|uniref:Uncharacterized protein n=1 Tax=Hymenolepis diminuta TaxID=6216 RepID=A0A0R3SCD4_HYMDI|nr:unnamed protein product [Hymenolepis diminuta]